MFLTVLSYSFSHFCKYDTIKVVFQQQSEMYHKNVCRVEDRIVSLSQPYVRPIKRGKAGANTEFGAKVAISVVNGYATIDKISWDNFNEALYLQQAVEGKSPPCRSSLTSMK
jgi:IS5 family transposase